MKRVIAVLFTATLLVGCADGNTQKLKHNTAPEGITYELFYIEGMPCMRVGRSFESGIWQYDGVTCDWSQWKGGGE